MSVIENIYNDAGIEYTQKSYNETSEELNCFIESLPEHYPPRKEFVIYKHTLQKDGSYILKFGDNGIAVFGVRDKEFRIIDFFLDTNFQNKSIMKELLAKIREEIFREFDLPVKITLLSLGSGVVAWHKLGFEFYNTKEKMKLIRIVSNLFQRKIALKDLTKNDLEHVDAYRSIGDGFAMYLEIKR